LIANYRTLEPLEPPLFRDGFEGDATVPGPVTITSFSATPNVIVVGESTTLSWSTENADSCTPSGGTGGWDSTIIGLPNGNASITIATTGTYTFSLVCQGPSGDQQTRSDVVTVSSEQQSCDSVTLAGNIVNWSEFWYQAFPGPVYENVTNYIIPRLGYLAIEFNTANIIDDGKISALENPSTPGIRTGSISTCPGDFDVPAECRYTWGLGGGLPWSTNGKLGTCALDSNTTYYFNITFTDGVDTDSSTCNLSPCRINLQHANF
jgi:hypothetical protein